MMSAHHDAVFPPYPPAEIAKEEYSQQPELRKLRIESVCDKVTISGRQPPKQVYAIVIVQIRVTDIRP